LYDSFTDKKEWLQQAVIIFSDKNGQKGGKNHWLKLVLYKKNVRAASFVSAFARSIS
jgi:hypothetical protein